MSKTKTEHELLPVITRVARALELGNYVATTRGDGENNDLPADLISEIEMTYAAGLTDSQSALDGAENANKAESAAESPKDNTPKLKIKVMDTAETLLFTQAFIAELEVEDGVEGDEAGPIAQNFINKVVAAQTAIGTPSLSKMTEEQNKLMSPALQTDAFNYRNNDDDSYAEITALAEKKPAKAKIE